MLIVMNLSDGSLLIANPAGGALVSESPKKKVNTVFCHTNSIVLFSTLGILLTFVFCRNWDWKPLFGFWFSGISGAVFLLAILLGYLQSPYLRRVSRLVGIVSASGGTILPPLLAIALVQNEGSKASGNAIMLMLISILFGVFLILIVRFDRFHRNIRNYNVSENGSGLETFEISKWDVADQGQEHSGEVKINAEVVHRNSHGEKQEGIDENCEDGNDGETR